MKIDFDPAKDQANIEKHGCSLALAEGFEWEGAYSWPDLRQDYGEIRISALGYVGSRLFAVIYTDRDDVRRIISLRKANAREERKYAET
jgi:uncharacterized DUF497 family protein